MSILLLKKSGVSQKKWRPPSTQTSPAHPAFFKKDGRHGFFNFIVVPLLQQYILRTDDCHLSSKMWDELGLNADESHRLHYFY
jgi:hypothetical protein